MNFVLLGLIFAAGALLVFGVNLLIADISEANRQRLREQLVEEARQQQRERARVAMQHRDLYELAAEESALLYEHKTLRERVWLLIDQAGVKTSPLKLLAIGLILAAAAGILLAWLTGSIVVGLLLAPVPAFLPWLWVRMVRAKRLAKLQSQLPDAFDLMGRTMRAGQTISQALQAVADDAGPPLAEEFGYCYDQQNLGMSPEAAMRDLARRTGLLEVRIFVLAVMVHRQTGGNLSVLLEKLSFVIRERYRITGMIKSLTAEGKLQAIVLFFLPIVVIGAMWVVNRDYILELFHQPVILIVTAGFMGLGAFWMRQIINFDF